MNFPSEMVSMSILHFQRSIFLYSFVSNTIRVIISGFKIQFVNENWEFKENDERQWRKWGEGRD